MHRVLGLALSVIFTLGLPLGCAGAEQATSRPAEAAATGAGPQLPAKPFTLVVLPDTQYYAAHKPAIFHDQTRWIAENAAALNIRYVLHVGDVTDDNSQPQWEVARAAFDHIEGKVPYAMVPGNHDHGKKGYSTSREGGMMKYFPVTAASKQAGLGGTYDKEPDNPHNTWHAFAAGGHKWLILGLEFAPRDDVLRWANEVAAAHADHRVIVITHAYLHDDGQRYDRKVKQKFPPHGYALARSPEGANDGQQIWDKLIARQPNMRLVICGHIWITARRVDKGAAGQSVHQMVVDYQTTKDSGFLRVLKFSADGNTVDVEDYSPTRKASSDVPDTKYTLKLE